MRRRYFGQALDFHEMMSIIATVGSRIRSEKTYVPFKGDMFDKENGMSFSRVKTRHLRKHRTTGDGGVLCFLRKCML